MGMMVDGRWQSESNFPTDSKGAFQRRATTFRERIEQAVPGRYHLYVSHACPWCHRVTLALALRKLTALFSVTSVAPLMGDDGWVFDPADPDPLFGYRYARELYRRAQSDYTGRVTVPILWDRQADRLVNNESSEILRMLSEELAEAGDSSVDLWPRDLREASDAWRERFYSSVNNGVYRCGFARSQEAYDLAVDELFEALEELEQHLESSRYLCGDRLTEADICLFPTLFRFDLVYVTHFKCNRRRLIDFPNLWAYTRAIYQLEGVAETCRADDVTQHYYRSHPGVNPSGIVAAGFELDFTQPHGRS